MPSITRAEVAHLARLARIDLRESQLDALAGQLDVILTSVARVNEVAAGDIVPMSHALPLTNVMRRGRHTPRPEPGPGAGRRAGSGGRAIPGAADPR